MITEVPLGQWLPDLADYKNPGVVTANNCYPTPGGYGPFLGASASSATVTGTTRGAITVIRVDGTVVKVVGTTSDLFVITGGSTTASSLGLSLGPDVYWSFEQFNNQLWAFAYGQTPHYLANLNTDTTFIPHPGIAPKAASCNRVGDFLVTANMEDIDASAQPYRLRWSQFNNPAGDYGTDIGTQTGAVDLPQSLGVAIGVFGGRGDVILQKFGVSRLVYTGGATAFRRELIEEERGCIAQPSAVTVGTTVYFLANDGFCRTDGASVQVISTGRVFEWFTENSEQSLLGSVQGAVDWKKRCVIWSFVPTGGASYTRQIIYSWDQDRWSTASLSVDWLFPVTEEGLTLEQVSALYPDIDAMSISLDSPTFKEKSRALGGVVSGGVVDITGDALEAEWETGDFQPQPGYRACTQAIYPLVENTDTNTTLAVGSRGIYKGETVDWSADVAVDTGGYAPIIKDGRYLRARMRVPAGAVWDKASGMQVEFDVSGRT